uniref:Glycoside hydrolase family 5 domain-containing protein n=1 Tax=Phytophthora ramorum TaxID=164328 RepID=H3H100_PHYRM
MAEAAEISRPMVGSMSGAPVSGSTYRNSEFTREAMDSSMRLTESGGQRDSSTYGPGGQRQTEMKLLAVEPDLGMPPERTKDYKGRIRTWPGLLLLLLIVAGAVALITINAIDVQDQMNINAQRFENASQAKRKIKDGLNDDSVIVSDDGQVGNPKKYPDMGCELPDYQSKNGQIFAVSKNGTEVPVGIKGVNWFGMETGLAIPFGLWENMDNGTSVYEIAAFLARNNFNSVRLPVCIKNILKDTIVEALGYRHITVLISLHTLDPKKSGGLTNAGENPVELTTEHKVVWAPHYYNTGVYPAWYLYESTGAVTASGAYESFVELGDDDLRYNVEKTMDKMFGYLAGSSDYAMVMGEFAGLYSKDVHPMKTTKRTTDYTIEVMVKAGYAGGYMWSLNPESAYQYNPATVYGTFTEGLLEDDWITPNKVFMEGMAAMEKIKNLKRFPCFPQKASSSGSS